ncbi:glutamyl-tRNA reductase [Crocosphaera chwakensis CCY0110]|uniref:Glutamyl-tRNA reductase n=1 Tax=Crocosphaera chwakensis CCY0110 TaxID=391612 RepID=A3IJE3_9CHRO|nr:glutamyl-tRNA reductase [Crocosphaera chwakensis CCY0110]
MLTKLHGSIF